MPGRILVSIILTAFTLAGLASIWGWQSLNSPMKIAPSGTQLQIAPGTPLSRVTDDLAARNILDAPWLLTGYARMVGDSTRIHAGEYKIRAGTSPWGLLEQLVTGRVILYSLTVVEGWRFDEFLTTLRAHPAIVNTNRAAETIMRELGAEGVHPEGQFYPDTYSFPSGTNDIDVLRQAHEAMAEVLESAWNRRRTLVVRNSYEALILASIIEKETALSDERQRIAGVFSRRLQRGMRLQTDPTVIYGLGDAYDGNLRRSDLNTDTPYNTYTRSGLPPTPIALPSAAALRAAVDPDDSDALYFVATGEPDGSHYFSATLEEHNKAVALYLQKLRSGGER